MYFFSVSPENISQIQIQVRIIIFKRRKSIGTVFGEKRDNSPTLFYIDTCSISILPLFEHSA
ncbi:hypothetical protein WS75_23000 [Burkholderia sp. FL-7-2-10-S1-D7]|nr:hypothetical protein WS75_23000 [Burkholderia sp. FL-7-2-10-S1-D7]